MKLKGLHHIAIICSDYERSKLFYTSVLGFEIIGEVYRTEKQSYKCDLSLNGDYLIELFSFPDPKPRPTQPEAMGLRHIAFSVYNINEAIKELQKKQIIVETFRVDKHSGKRFTFFRDPDDLPIELYEV
ncbi:MAG: VOC family protein [Bacteroidota bacterium]